MATTTNYGWTTPDDTALVKDGASAIRTLGSSIDTTTKNLNPETTLGDLSFRSSTSNVNTRIPIGSSGQHLTVVAGVPAWATASDQTPLTTKGDLLGFSTLDARIPVGTDTHVLTADSTQSLGVKWAAPSAGALTKITSATFTSVASVDVDGCFTSTYKRYLVQVKSFAATTGDDFQLQWRESGVTKTSGYTGSGYGIDRSNSTEAYGYVSASQITLSTTSAVSNSVAGSYSFYVDNVGTGGSLGARLWGNGFQSDNAQQSLWFGGGGVAVTATGFRLKSAASNITGEYAVYGLEN